MNQALRLAVAAAVVTALWGCGGGAPIGSKEEAAAVAYGAGSNGAKGALMRLYQSGIDSSGQATVACTNGGEVSLKVDLSGLFGEDLNDISLAYTLTYDGCTEPVWDDPETEAVEREDVTYDGELTMNFKASASASGAYAGMSLVGKVDVSGALRDSVEMDITQSVSATAEGASITIDGSIKTSSESYTYSNETIALAGVAKG